MVILLRCFAFTFGVFGGYCRLNRFSCIPIIHTMYKFYLVAPIASYDRPTTSGIPGLPG